VRGGKVDVAKRIKGVALARDLRNLDDATIAKWMKLFEDITRLA